MSTKGITMPKIGEDAELKKESYLLKTPPKKRSFRKEVRTSLGRSIKKLTRAFFSEPNLRRKSRSGIVPMKLDLSKESFAASEIAGGVNESVVENDTSVVLDDNIPRATTSDNISSTKVNDTTSSDKQNLGSDKYIATESRTLTDIAIALSAVVFLVGVVTAFIYMALNIEQSDYQFLKKTVQETCDALVKRLDIQGMKLTCGKYISALVGYFKKVFQTTREKILNWDFR